MKNHARLPLFQLLLLISLLLLILFTAQRLNETPSIVKSSSQNMLRAESPRQKTFISIQSVVDAPHLTYAASEQLNQLDLDSNIRRVTNPQNTILPLSDPDLSAAQEGKALHIVQFSGPIRDKWLAAVEAAGGELVHYIGNDSYLIWINSAERQETEQLEASNEYLLASFPYTADFKLDNSLAEAQASKDPAYQVTVTIQILHHTGSQRTKDILDQIIIDRLGSWHQVLNYENLNAVVPLSTLNMIANLPDVVWIATYETPQVSDEVQAQILAGNLNANQTEPAGPGYLDWLMARGFSTDPRKYPIIDITDDGIGTGIAAAAAGDNTFRIAGDQQQESRLVYLKNCTSAADAQGASGHGHINASIAAGYDNRSGFPFQDEEGYQHGMGINPFGRLAGTRIINGSSDLSKCEWDYLYVLKQSYQAGARIVSNSWNVFGYEYNPTTQAYDTAVRDADATMPGNQEMLILFSVGNNGGQAGTINAPANGKNVIAIGATENVRPTWIDGNGCGYGAEDADNAQDVARYSGRGPVPGGRVKPDLVAPGTHIIGTASTSPHYNGSAVCDRYHPPDQELFAASSGTSHAAPAVAGYASLVSFWLTEKLGTPDPSPALLKAFLVASSSYLRGAWAGDDLPSNNQGFGIPNMTRAFNHTARIIVEQETPPQFKESGQSWSMDILPADRTQPVRIVMAFTDQPGAATNPLNDPLYPRINDLDLIVKTDNGIYFGNKMSGEWSQSGLAPDSVNTVEAVFLPVEPRTSIEIVVKAANIAGDGVPGNEDITDQDFALVCHNCRRPISFNYHAFLPNTFAP